MLIDILLRDRCLDGLHLLIDRRQLAARRRPIIGDITENEPLYQDNYACQGVSKVRGTVDRVEPLAIPEPVHVTI